MTVTTVKNGKQFRAVVKIIRPKGEGEILMMMGNSFASAEMAEDYGIKSARDWIDENME